MMDSVPTSWFEVMVLIGEMLFVFSIAFALNWAFRPIGKLWMRFEGVCVKRWGKYQKRKHLESLRRR